MNNKFRFLNGDVDSMKKEDFNQKLCESIIEVTGEKIQLFNPLSSGHMFNNRIEMWKPSKLDRTPGSAHYTSDSKLLICIRDTYFYKYHINALKIENLKCYHCPHDRNWLRIKNGEQFKEFVEHLHTQGYVFGDCLKWRNIH